MYFYEIEIICACISCFICFQLSVPLNIFQFDICKTGQLKYLYLFIVPEPIVNKIIIIYLCIL